MSAPGAVSRSRDARILVTGFEAFGRHGANPTADLVAGLAADAVPGANLETAVLPVSYRRAVDRLLERVTEARPDAVVCCGLAAGRAGVSVERIGVNVMDAPDGGDLADNDGRRPREEPVVAGAPDGLFATLPVRDVVAALRAAGIPATVSLTAGTYVCNAVLYAVLEHVRRTSSATLAGFLHFPATPELALTDPDCPSMAAATMRRALQVTLCTVAAQVGSGGT